LAYYAADAFHVVSSTGEESVIAAPTTDPRLRIEQILAPDGSRWYDTALSGKVTRHVILNYGDRPWR
jgi:hypothetical protein